MHTGAELRLKKKKLYGQFWPKLTDFVNKVCGWCWVRKSWQNKYLSQKCGFNKLLFMRCVHKSLVLSSNFVGISLNWPSVLGSTSSSTKKISFSLAFNAAHVSKLIVQRLVFKTLSAHPSSVLGVRLMSIISVCSLYVKLSIRQASTEIMLLCAKSCIMMFGWCILLVSAVSVKRINSSGIKWLLMMCMAAVATIF